MKRHNIIRKIITTVMIISVIVSGMSRYSVSCALADERREGDIVYLDSDIREADNETVNDWAVESGLIEEPVSSEKICRKIDFVRILWIRNCKPEYKADALTFEFADVDEKDVFPALWAYKNGVAAVDANKSFKPDTELTHGDVLQALWYLKGRPDVTEEVTGFGNLNPGSSWYPAALWAAEQKLLIKDEKTDFDGSEKCSLIEALRYVYYQYHVRSTFPINRTQLVEACARVAEEARVNGYRYGNSGSGVPTADGIISCDRLIAKALWDLGYTDQRAGGLTLGDRYMYSYLLSHGFEQSFDLSDIGYGSIVCTWPASYEHTFVVVSWDPSTGTIVKYDMGTQGRINSYQPFTETWGTGDFICVFNIPDE